MKRNTMILGFAWMTMIVTVATAQAPVYQVRYPLAGGGIVWDVGLALHGDPEIDPVWAACDNNGIYRAHWVDYNTGWSDWEEYLPGKYGMGVDVIVTADEDQTEHVLAATSNWGLFYETSTDGDFCPSVWARPNPEAPYPEDWELANIRDAAFHCDADEKFPETPDDSIYVILALPIGADQNLKNPGLYYWNPELNPDNFDRLDGDELDDPHVYDHFYRDLEDSNKIYVTSPDGIYKLSGSYSNPKFEKLPAGTRLQDLPIARPPLASFKLQAASHKP